MLRREGERREKTQRKEESVCIIVNSLDTVLNEKD